MIHPKDIHAGETFYHCVCGVCIEMHAFTEPYRKNGLWVWKAKDNLGNTHEYSFKDLGHPYLFEKPIYKGDSLL